MWSVRSVSEATVQKDCSHNQNGGQSEREGPREKPSSERNQEHWQCSGHGSVIAIISSRDSSGFWAATIAVWTQQNKLWLILDLWDWRFLWCCWGLLKMWCYVKWVIPAVLKECHAFIIEVKQSKSAWPWRQRPETSINSHTATHCHIPQNLNP